MTEDKDKKPYEYCDPTLPRKVKNIPDAIYNLTDGVKMTQEIYRQLYPDDLYLPRHKIKKLFEILFHLIMHSVDRGAVVQIHDFGSFKRSKLMESYTIYNNKFHKEIHVPRRYNIVYSAYPKFKKTINDPNYSALDEIFNHSDEIDDENNAE